MPLKIGLVYDLESDFPFTPNNADDANSEFDSERTIIALKKGIKDVGFKLIDLGNFENLLNIRNSIRSKVDIIFNIAEGIKGRNREAQVPLLLEYLNMPFVGSDALTMSLTLDKIMTKQLLIAQNISTPNYESYTEDKINKLKLKFPLIVKPRWEGSSMGISMKSIVYNMQNLVQRANFIVKTYHQPALIEEFISGSEYTVPVIGNSPPRALIPMKVLINGQEMNNKIYDNSFIRTENISYVPLTSDKKLEGTLCNLAVKTYDVVNCLDFGRIDFRVDKNGKIFVLELNPLPALNLQDALAVSANYKGWTFSALLEKIIKSALIRYGKIN